MKRSLLPLLFVALFVSTALLRAATDTAGPAVQEKFARRAEPGTFPDMWINGVDCGTEPIDQVHAYNDDLYIIRQSKCDSFEAPFIYMIFGSDMVLVLDTGSQGSWPVADTVFQVYNDWLVRTGSAPIPIVVAHTHSHFDHVFGDNQFAGLPNVTLIQPNLQSVIDFWGFQDYPNDTVQVDLGDRVLDVFGTPGHEPTSITVYDRRTQLMLSGDIVYPGHLFIFTQTDLPIFRASIERMRDFALENPVKWVVGCHVEMGNEPFSLFQYTTIAQPDEHPLEFAPDVLQRIVDAIDEQVASGMQPKCQVYEDFALHLVYQCGILWNG